MDQFRMLIAIGLSFLVFLVWGHFFAEKKPGPDKTVQTAEQTQKASQTVQQTPFVQENMPAVPAAALSAQTTQARMITVNAPLYAVTISEKGAAFKSFALKNYREKIERDSPMKELVSEEISDGTILLGFKDKSLPGLSTAIFAARETSDAVTVSDGTKEISFSWTSPRGVVVEKTYRFSPETYKIGLTVSIKNGSAQAIKDSLTLSLVNKTPGKAERYGFTGPSALINKSLENIKIKKIEEKSAYPGMLRWIAYQDRYFLSSIIPKTTTEATMRLFLHKNDLLETQYLQPESVIQPGTQQSFDYLLFLGPKSVRTLKSINYDLDRAVNFGWFDFIAKPCVWLMNFLYSFIPNYGVAIIILTLFIKLLLWPLGTKSYKSMNEMKRLQPLMTELREKYKNDKQRMNQEVMGLYKTYKINPMSGCLPMVAQIPVFFALYRMLYESIELRHAPFFGWINDLSAPDRLFSFDFSIPLMDPPYGIPVLTIIMGASMLLQQKMTPAQGDPMQQKMMMLMPVVFTFIFINFSSGLVLYWLVNNILSISQQYYISKKSA